MFLRKGGFKRALTVGALALAAVTTFALGAPKAQARVDLGIDLGVPPVAVAPPPVVVTSPATVVAPPAAVAGPISTGRRWVCSPPPMPASNIG